MMVCVVVVMVRGGVVCCMSVMVIVIMYVVSVSIVNVCMLLLCVLCEFVMVLVLGGSGGVYKSERVCTDVCVSVRWVYHNYGEK